MEKRPTNNVYLFRGGVAWRKPVNHLVPDFSPPLVHLVVILVRIIVPEIRDLSRAANQRSIVRPTQAPQNDGVVNGNARVPGRCASRQAMDRVGNQYIQVGW